MKNKKSRQQREVPSIPELKRELKRVRYRKRYHAVLRSTIYTLVTVAAAAILVATLWLPVLQTYGSSMTPTLNDGDIIFSLKTSSFETGDIISFYYNNKILVKRVIASAGDWVDIDSEGNVSVNDIPIEEPYLSDKALGDCNITLPYQVPDGKVFVMGDHRDASHDSRRVGPLDQSMLIGRVFMLVWPPRRWRRFRA